MPKFYCGVTDPGGVDAAAPVDPVEPGLVMLDPPDEPVAEPLRRGDLLAAVLVPPIGIDPIVLPGVPPIVLPGEPVGALPVMPGAVEALPVPVEVPVVIDPLAPGAAAPPAVWALAAVVTSAATVIAIIVFILLLR